MKKALIVLLMAIVAISLFVGCKKEPEVKDEPSVDVVGTWIYGTREGDDAEYISFTFNADKTASLQECKDRNTNSFSSEISYEVKGSTITISASKGREWKYTAELKNGKLVLTQVGDATWLEEFSGLKEITLDRYYIISFNSNGGSTVYDQRVKSGEKATRPTDPTKTDNYLAAWNKADGKKFNFTEGTVNADITLTAVWKKTYTVGQAGPAGGVVFYDVDADNASGNADGVDSYTLGWRYMEVANENLTSGSSRFTWGDNGEVSTGTAVGTGKDNTKAMHDTLTNTVAKQVWGVTFGEYSDWFIPSKDELQLLRQARGSVSIGGTWPNSSFWSSSANGTDRAYALWTQGDIGSAWSNPVRTDDYYVRLIRYI